jgi:hypothetical protein
MAPRGEKCGRGCGGPLMAILDIQVSLRDRLHKHPPPNHHVVAECTSPAARCAPSGFWTGMCLNPKMKGLVSISRSRIPRAIIPRVQSPRPSCRLPLV